MWIKSQVLVSSMVVFADSSVLFLYSSSPAHEHNLHQVQKENLHACTGCFLYRFTKYSCYDSKHSNKLSVYPLQSHINSTQIHSRGNPYPNTNLVCLIFSDRPVARNWPAIRVVISVVGTRTYPKNSKNNVHNLWNVCIDCFLHTAWLWLFGHILWLAERETSKNLWRSTLKSGTSCHNFKLGLFAHQIDDKKSFKNYT